MIETCSECRVTTFKIRSAIFLVIQATLAIRQVDFSHISSTALYIYLFLHPLNLNEILIRNIPWKVESRRYYVVLTGHSKN